MMSFVIDQMHNGEVGGNVYKIPKFFLEIKIYKRMAYVYIQISWVSAFNISCNYSYYSFGVCLLQF